MEELKEQREFDAFVAAAAGFRFAAEEREREKR